ncbi:serine/threonine-protein kinase [Kribbella lupini]|uniref:non-specific serine/threonine protein kinase n=1 Tax=Kribbella lupini TaxID=291602 RepID=A0ABP4MUP6_9ACTN
MLVAKRYKLGPSIGRGGMGEVFRAVDEVLERPVAVKLLLPTDRDTNATERFQREARAAARLSDPHVVSVYDFGQHGDGFFLVMELVEGRDVSRELEDEGPLAKDRAIDIVEQAARGLAAAHRVDVVHRDVKPGNLLVAADGTVKVADFGIASVPGGATTLTKTGQIIGSSRYLAPERARGGRAGQPSDVYALGCVLYQLVTGQPPFTADNPTAILYQHVDADPVPPSTERPELAGAFEQVLLQMLAKDPAARPTAAEIAGGALRARPVGSDWQGLAAGAAGAGAAGLAGAAGVAAAGPDAPTVAAAGVPAGDGSTLSQGLADPTAAVPPGGVVPAAGTTGGAGQSRTKVMLISAVGVLVAAAAAITGIVLYGNEPTQPPTTDLRPNVTPSTPGTDTGTTEPSTTNDPTRTGPTGPATSSQPTQTPSSTPTPTTTPSGTPTPTTSPTVQPSTTPTTPTQPTQTPTTTTPSSTPPPDTPPPSTPANPPTTPDERNSATPQPD